MEVFYYYDSSLIFKDFGAWGKNRISEHKNVNKH